MKHYIFVVLLGLTWYLAGIYKSLSLMIFSIFELLIFVVLILTSFYNKSNIEILFDSDKDAIISGKRSKFNIITKNNGKIPISRFFIPLKIKYKNSNEKEQEQKIMGGAKIGEDILSFEYVIDDCGVLECCANKALVYDQISMYSVWKNLKLKKEIIVLPDTKPLRFTDKLGSNSGYNSGMDIVANKSGFSSEFDQIREYRDGDSYKNIHWKLSSKTDDIMIKTFKDEVKENANVLIDATSIEGKSLKELSAFYSLIYSTLKGLLNVYSNIGVEYKCKEHTIDVIILDKCDITALIIGIMTNNFDSETLNNVIDKPSSYFCKLNGNLELLIEDILVKRFDSDNIKNDIDTTEIMI